MTLLGCVPHHALVPNDSSLHSVTVILHASSGTPAFWRRAALPMLPVTLRTRPRTPLRASSTVCQPACVWVHNFARARDTDRNARSPGITAWLSDSAIQIETMTAARPSSIAHRPDPARQDGMHARCPVSAAALATSCFAPAFPPYLDRAVTRCYHQTSRLGPEGILPLDAIQ